MFKQYSRNAKLPQETILSLLKDSNGRLWVGTQSGLSWFDGYQFNTVAATQDAPNTLSDAFIWSLEEDENGNIWIGTKNGGLNRYNPESRELTKFHSVPNDPTKLGSDNITSLFRDSKNNLWIGTAGAGLYLFDKQNQQFKAFRYQVDNQTSIGSDFISTIEEDTDGSLWIGHGYMYTNQEQSAGISIFNPETGSAKRLAHDESDQNTISSNRVYSLLIEEDFVWAGTYGKGLNRIDRESGEVKRYPVALVNAPENKLAIIFDIVRYDADSLLIGSLTGGLYFLNQKSDKFTKVTSDEKNPFSLKNINITKLLLDQDNLWVGTWWEGLQKHLLSSQEFNWVQPKNDEWRLKVSPRAAAEQGSTIWLSAESQGLVRWNRKENIFRREIPPEEVFADWKNHLVQFTYVDQNNDLWIGTTNGAAKRNNETNTFERYSQIPAGDIVSISEYPKGKIWIGVVGIGLYELDIKSGKTRTFLESSQSSAEPVFNKFSTNSIAFDLNGHAWIGTHEGLVKLNPKTGDTQKFHRDDNQQSVKHNSITGIKRDSEGNIWITSFGGGLTKASFNGDEISFKHYDAPNALPDNNIDALLLDDEDNVWMTSAGRIIRFSPKTNQSHVFDKFDGAMPGDFISGSSLKTKNGTMMFLGLAGINYFAPKKVSFKENLAKAWLSKLTIYDDSQENSDAQSVTSRPIAQGEKITLNHHQNMFSIEFTALDYLNPINNQFAYRMVGFNEQWINTTPERRIATFTGLPAGDYEFQVKFANKFGYWSEQVATLPITIVAAPWLSWWAYLSYTALVISTIGGFLWQRHKVALANQERKLAETANETKSTFLATMSHEIRTPINGVIGSISLLSETPLNEEQRSFAKAIKVSGENLLYIVNDILDLSKIEAGELALENHQFDLRTCIEYAIDVFSAELDKKPIDLVFLADNDVPLNIDSDSTRIRQVIVNLVGNAIKFTQQGEVAVLIKCESVKESKYQLKFTIRDTGEGISEEKQKYVFEAFKQADASVTRTHGGTGLGLSISQHIVYKLGGEIDINSTPGVGTEFFFTLPIQSTSEFTSINYLGCAPHISEKKLLLVGFNGSFKDLLTQFCQKFDIEATFLNDVESILGVSSQRFDFCIVNSGQINSQLFVLLDSLKDGAQHSIQHWLLITTPQQAHRNEKDISKYFDGYLLKPFKQRLLAKKLESFYIEPETIEKEKSKTSQQSFATEYPLEVLLAEDNAVNQKILLHTFRNLGYEPDIVSNGYEILSAFAVKKYDLLIADMYMPGMDGLDACRLLRHNEENSDVQILICSAEDPKIFEEDLSNKIIQGVVKKNLTTALIKPWLQKSYESLQSSNAE